MHRSAIQVGPAAGKRVAWLLALLLAATFGAFAVQVPASAAYTTTVTNFNTAGQQVIRFDTGGNAVDAHDGEIAVFNGVYYLYGTSYDCGFRWQGPGAAFCGFKSYSSPDLVHWTDEGPLFDAVTPTWQTRCNGATYGCYRPHVVRNASTGLYVLWVNTYDNSNGFHVFTGTAPTGPFTEAAVPTLAVNNAAPVGGVNNGDHDVFVDDDGTAYLVYTDWRTGGDLVIERLNAAYLSGTGSYTRLNQGSTEAPAMFRRDGSYYVLFSDPNCGYCTTGTSYRRASSPLGTWSAKTLLTPNSCGGQPAFVTAMPVTGGTSYLYGSDLWNNAAPNEALANFYWGPLTFAGDGSINPIACQNSFPLALVSGSAGSDRDPADLDRTGGAADFRSYCDIGGSVQRAQTFTASRTGTLSSVSFTSFQAGTPTAGLTLDVYQADASSRPTGAVLASTTVAAGSVGWSPRNVTARTSVAVTQGSRYAIVVRSATTGGCYGLAYNDSAPYPGGGGAYSSNGGATFSAEANRTLKFQTTIGTTNLAPGSAVSASSSFEGCCGWGLAKLTDGQNTSTPTSAGWSSTNSTGANHTESVQLDLGSSKVVSRVTLHPRSDAGNVGEGFPADFRIEVSANGSTWTAVAVRTAYPKPVSGTAQAFDFGAQTARYVRILGTSLRNTNPNDPLYRMQFAELAIS
ncbi:hypothetical protein F4553_007763 [Allocatelliglobosispora scoriae]|uniref:F5/8 type C domain-containing protein n=1 Tax=Allocatelliglobosispora scoriae TaxID=643052 RepID=A0A841C4V8_9ACTN|nr:family 43 glycosylhydrolase [Allocatelliglobosispora scoriae]MBB5874329.1 hypothetical protein [Allocatelliglobosispora scoriae]